MEEEIKAEFNKMNFALDEEEEILKKCKLLSSFPSEFHPQFQKRRILIDENLFDSGLAFCINYNLKPSDIVSSWEVYYLNRSITFSSISIFFFFFGGGGCLISYL